MSRYRATLIEGFRDIPQIGNEQFFRRLAIGAAAVSRWAGEPSSRLAGKDFCL